MKLIDKDVLVAELERIVDVLERNSGYGIFCEYQMVICEKILSFLDTLEVKEVDLEEELKTLDNTLFDLDGVAVQGGTYYLTVEDVKDIAKRFYELGLKAQRESKFESCIQEGDKIVTNDDGTHFNISQLERVSQKATDTKETAKKFLKTVGIMDKNGELADEYRLEPKFKVGDWVVDNFGSTWKIEGIILNQFYLLKGVGGGESRPTIEWVDKTYHLWTIQDAKDGDVFVGSGMERNVILMFRGIGNTEWDDVIDYHCYYDYHRKDFIVQKGLEYWGNTVNNQLKPATKEQCDLLFQKIKEAGYIFDFEKKELKKIEPKFKVGDWIVTPENKVLQITSIEGASYSFNNESHYWEICYCDEKCHLWTIKDAKDGDVLCDGIDTVIYKKNIYDMIRRSMYVHCGINNKNEYWYEVGGISPIDYSPATKEQRDLLFQKMKEAGYEWNTEKKELKKIKIITPLFNVGDTIAKKHNSDIHDFGSFTITDITGDKYWYNDRIICDITEQDEWELYEPVRQKSAWSYEDEYLLDETIQHLEELIGIDKSKYFGDNVQYYQRDITWLKSLKERLKGE